MKFLKGLWGGIKKGFNFVKKHKVLSFLLGGVVLGTVVGMAVLGAPFLPALIGAAAVTGGALVIGGAVFGTGVLVGGLVLTAAMGIGGALGIGKDKKKEPEPTPVVGVHQASECPHSTPAAVLPGNGAHGAQHGDGLIRPLTDDGAPAPVVLADPSRRHQTETAGADTAAVQPPALGLTSVLAEDVPVAPTPITELEHQVAPTPITELDAEVPAAITELPPPAKQLKTVDLPLGATK